MEKIIEIDLYAKEDLTEKYNKKIASKYLISYMIEESMIVDKKDTIKIIVNNRCNLSEDCLTLIKNGLELEYQKNLRNCRKTNIKQVSLMILGILLLFLSTTFRGMFIFEEVFLIIGWVPIWEAVDIELFSDIKEKKKRNILKKLLKSEFEINKH